MTKKDVTNRQGGEGYFCSHVMKQDKVQLGEGGVDDCKMVISGHVEQVVWLF